MLGANNGTISVASLVIGVAAAGASPGSVLLTGMGGLVAGAMSMAAGEYVSVRSQADIKNADIERENRELGTEPELELEEWFFSLSRQEKIIHGIFKYIHMLRIS